MSESTAIPNELFRYERNRRNWTQKDLADRIDGLKEQGEIDRTKAIRRWEDGVSRKPMASYRRQLEAIFGRKLAQLGFPEKGRISFEHIPPRNSCFTGRKDVLMELQTNLTQVESKGEVLPQVLTGVEGIGKTQIALEFAYLHKFNYHTVVWLRAQSLEMLNKDFAAIATLIDLPAARNETDEQKIIKLVKEWLGNEDITRWLLVFDQVENEDILRNIYHYIPSHYCGHVIITTRLPASNRETHEIEIKKGLKPEDGAHLLLKRAKLIGSSISTSEDNYRLATEIAQMLEGFPYIIDELGAQIKATGRNLADIHQMVLHDTQLHPKKRISYEQSAGGDSEESSSPYAYWLTKRNQESELYKVLMETAEDIDEANREVGRLYLERTIQDTYLIGLMGIPGLISQRVPLDQVFIPLRFHPNRPRVDYPLNDEEINTYREGQKRGISNIDLEQMLFEAEKNWVDPHNRDTISFAALWQSLTPQVPAVVIQGYPGMGKSTLMARLALHMARMSLTQGDPTMDDAPTPPRIPVLLSLGKYARERKAHPLLPLTDYLKSVLNELNIQGVDTFIEKCLRRGLCLVMLDGLDEASIDDSKIREQIQEEIKDFIRNLPGNHFLITSRVAGYDQAAFPDYTHFLIANLTLEQIEGFLPRWCRAHVTKMRGLSEADQLLLAEPINAESVLMKRAGGNSTSLALIRESINAESTLMEQGLGEAIKSYPAVRHLAENPLLLTLLAVMHQNSIQLPERRVELYDVVTRTLLEHRNKTRDLPWIPEEQALAYLGSLAYKMQETGNSFATQDEVMKKLADAINQFQGGTPEEVESEVQRFLFRLRERGGIFVLRASDYFGFFHRTFQEYFAARYILNKIDHDPDREIPQLIMQVRRSDDLWREPFLLAVAYETGENKYLAQQIIKNLLDASQEGDFSDQAHTLLLATDCVIEAKAFTMEPGLLRRIAELLLQFYEQAQRLRKFDVCSRIEDAVHRWLATLPAHSYRPALLVTLENTLSDTQHAALQRSTLTLLAMIAQELDDCRSVVFETLIPLLLALAGLPAIDEFKPTKSLAASDDPANIDLALTVLCFMGKHGPTGLLLKYIREYFQFHPDQLCLLARYSLESSTLLTPVVIPSSPQNYKRYEQAIGQWITMRDQKRNNSITESEIEMCLSIHQNLLDCAEEVCYPSGHYFLDMLQDSVCLPDQPWQQTWQHYLLDQLAASDSISYQEIVLLWTTLFPEPEMQDVVAQRVLRDYENGEPSAQHFIALLSNDLTEPRELRDLREIRYLRYLRDVNYVTYLKFVRNMPHIRHLKHLSYLKNLSSMQYMKYLSLMRYQRYLRYWLFTEQVAKIAMHRLSSPITAEDKDLLAILFGRIRQIQESPRKSHIHEHELQEIAETVEAGLASADSEEMRDVMLDILSLLPILR